MNRLYQWLSKRASFFLSHPSSRGTGRTVRTEVTVERQGTAMLVGSAAVGFDLCPFCGQELGPTMPAERTGRHFRRVPNSEEDLSSDGN